ncbi:HelD family protein [Paractinoplanes rishiriensis]|uniref:UvrD-like helicase C-terminal domain-containing protein n=1 Tax=Paractinoplanes rishiriensis TaxID=1050105 RepID=A0A919K4G2_9ACTN|nr:AAA family ATPase [Actinoplanes rishiriensis]GIE99374.1 hypothetical protein Ari01nite_68390 [Actinoplanes rishiriensis]
MGAPDQAAVTAMYEQLDASRAALRAAGTPDAARRLRDLDAAEPGLCFGRIDHQDGTTLYIGRCGVRSGGEPLLIDWRAPAARPFYAATAAHPMGLRRRRHLRLDGRTVRSVSDEILDGSAPAPGDVLGDGPLTEALTARRTGRMRDAVTTLQAEQDAIVRSANRGITVVQGGPGTGKTVVALHRAAYVLFAHPPASRGVLVVGPDARFLDYISEVLPSLGENNVHLTTRAAIAVPGVPPGSGPAPAPDPAAGRAGNAAALAGWVRSRQPAPAPLTLPAGPDQAHLPEAVVAEALAAASGLPHNPGRQAFRDYLIAELIRRRHQATADDLARIDAETAALTGVDLDAAVAADLAALGLDDTPAAPPELDDPEALRATLRGDPRLDAAIDAVWPRLTPAEVVAGALPFTGPALLDEAAALVDGPPAEVFGHVVVDEAQELTEMDWRAVLRRCPSRSMTVVGDFAQAGPGSTVTTWAEALAPNRFDLHTLTINYRTTAEILDHSRDLLGRIAPDQTLSRSLRHGEKPTVRTVAAEDLADAVRAEPDATVLCADDSPLGIPVSSCRGLEFDTVVVADPARIAAAGLRDLYVALTRATQRLVVLEVAPTYAANQDPDRSGRPV